MDNDNKSTSDFESVRAEIAINFAKMTLEHIEFIRRCDDIIVDAETLREVRENACLIIGK